VSFFDKNETQNSPGTVNTDNKTYLCVKTLDGWVSIDCLQPEGKRKMKTEEFLRGNKI
jgi:methionyl-tRNA formyltransferase